MSDEFLGKVIAPLGSGFEGKPAKTPVVLVRREGDLQSGLHTVNIQIGMCVCVCMCVVCLAILQAFSRFPTLTPFKRSAYYRSI